jgi:hypothetical protein
VATVSAAEQICSNISMPPASSITKSLFKACHSLRPASPRDGGGAVAAVSMTVSVGFLPIGVSPGFPAL